jgi:hypothetical protein
LRRSAIVSTFDLERCLGIHSIDGPIRTTDSDHNSLYDGGPMRTTDSDHTLFDDGPMRTTDSDYNLFDDSSMRTTDSDHNLFDDGPMRTTDSGHNSLFDDGLLFCIRHIFDGDFLSRDNTFFNDVFYSHIEYICAFIITVASSRQSIFRIYLLPMCRNSPLFNNLFSTDKPRSHTNERNRFNDAVSSGIDLRDSAKPLPRIQSLFYNFFSVQSFSNAALIPVIDVLQRHRR